MQSHKMFTIYIILIVNSKLHFKVIFKSMTGPDDPRQVDLEAWMG